jgi:hypothetical protein
MANIILGILIIAVFWGINRWLKKNTYHDPKENTAFYYHDISHGTPDLGIYEDEHSPSQLDFDKSHGTPDLDCGIYEDEHSPSQLDFDKSLKSAILRTKLKKIESEKNDVDLNYQDETGR